MNKCLLKLLAFAPFLIIILTFSFNPVSALSCSYTFSTKGCNISLTPSLSIDTEYYRWTIERTDDNMKGWTDWIYHNYSFTQMFSLEKAGEYLVTLQVKDNAGNIESYSRVISTSMSSLSSMERLSITEETKQERVNVFNSLISFFNSMSLPGKIGFIIVSIILSVFLVDVVFHVFPEKGVLYKVTHRR